jgi:hypothetical protein
MDLQPRPTMSAILLVPTPGDPHGLLAPGVCGARVPTLYNSTSCGYDAHRGWRERHDVRGDCYMCGHPDEALVLAWEGEPVPEGVDRAIRRLNRHIGRMRFLLDTDYTDAAPDPLAAVRWIAEICATRLDATVVVLP